MESKNFIKPVRRISKPGARPALYLTIMSYTVIARKYRPQKFEELIGQKPIAETLANAIKDDKISHAYLFAGPRGVGKTSTARILSKSLNCEKGPTPNPCGVCKNCIEITEGNSLDVVEIDGASNRGIDEIRNLKEKVSFAPANSKYKIYIIDEVHMLTEPAFNALLKTLEEPPPHIVFIFATTEPHKIPATVLSRCQRYDFRRISISEIVQHLKKIAKNENVNITDDALFLIAKNSDGSLRDSQSTLDQLIAFAEGEITEEKVRQLFGISDVEIYQAFLKSIVNEEIKNGLKIIYEIYNKGIDLKQFVTNLIEFLRNIFLVKIGIDDINILEESKDKIEIFKRFAKDFESEVLQEMIIYLTELLNNFRYTIQFKSLLEIGFLNLINIYKKVTLKFIYEFVKEFAQEDIANIKFPKKKPLQEPVKEKEKDKDKELSSVSAKIEDKWNEVINKLEKTSKIMSVFLREGKIKEIKNNTIYILFDKRFNYDNLNNENTRAKIIKIMNEVFNTSMNIDFILEEKKSEPKNKFESTPVIKKAQEIFKGTIINTTKE